MKYISYILVFFPCFLNAQITVTNNASVTSYVQNVLAGSGVVISNVQYNGTSGGFAQEQVGAFTSSSGSVGLSSGLILGSGNVTMASNPNLGAGSSLGGGTGLGSDVNLQSITASQIFDECVVEFDFIPSGNTIRFRYVFASEEYEEYVCGTVNDAFGFFLTGPNPAGGNYTANNLALIPDPTNPSVYTTTPVSINTVNPGVQGSNAPSANACNLADPNWASYNVFYAPNSTDDYEYDGRTVVLVAEAPVECNQTYHIKLAIGDGGDGLFDSGVFLEEGSFASNPVTINVSSGSSGFNHLVGDTSIVEGCNGSEASFSFIRRDTTGSLSIALEVGGTATNGVDYNLLSDSIYFAPGVDSLDLVIQSISDVITEGTEDITLTTIYVTDCGDTVTSTGTLYIVENYDYPAFGFGDTTLICRPDSMLIWGNATGGVPPFSIEWSTTNQTGDSIYVYPTEDTNNYVVSAIDACNVVALTDTVSIIFEYVQPLQANMNDTALCNGAAFVLLNSNPSGGTAPFDFLWNTGLVGENILVSPTETTTYWVTITDSCGVESVDSVTVSVSESPLTISVTPPAFLCEEQPLTLTPELTGGNPPFEYIWSGSSGNITAISSTGELTVNGAELGNQSYSLIVDDVCNQQVSTTVNVNVLSCSVFVPNIITPNGDDINDYFVIENLKYHSNVRMTIYNRWGRVVYRSDDYKNNWNGTSNNGNKLTEGVYFYVLELEDDSFCKNTSCRGHITLVK